MKNISTKEKKRFLPVKKPYFTNGNFLSSEKKNKCFLPVKRLIQPMKIFNLQRKKISSL